ncbi:ParB-like partition protein (fragment) [Thiomonas sp. X19]|uniref:ParB/RepB/Spo0J family partition protein n=1 Tax=Thiomonas sp. X19 TaxID=1050370 RepID=UPI000B757663
MSGESTTTGLDPRQDLWHVDPIINLPLQLIRPDPQSLRRACDPQTLEELAQSMAMVGQLQPIGVRRDGAGWRVVYGERRWRAAQLLNWPVLQARVLQLQGPAERVVQACENLHREALSLSEQAGMVLRLVEAGMPVEAVARALGRHTAWVQAMLAIVRDPVAQALIDAGRLDSAQAWTQFMALPPAARKALLDTGQMITVLRCAREEATAREREREQATKRKREPATRRKAGGT